MRIPLSVLLTALLVTSVPLSASAEPDAGDEERGWAVVVEGGTQFPVFAGGGVRLEMPLNLSVHGDLGVLPQAYGKLVNDVAQDIGSYDDATAFIIDQAFEDSLVYRVGGAWHPFGGGFYLGLTYAFVDLSGSVSDQEALEQALPGAQDLPDGFSGSVPIDTTLHMLQGELGYQWEILPHLLLRVALGVSATLDGSVDFGVPRGLPPALEDQARELERIGEDYLEGILTDYVHTPTGTIAIGYRF